MSSKRGIFLLALLPRRVFNLLFRALSHLAASARLLLLLQYLNLFFKLGFSEEPNFLKLLQGFDLFHELLRTEVGSTTTGRDSIAGSFEGSV